MNYRHAFHAGNFADVMKHALLVRMLLHLRAKETPFRVVDTHAGIGRYDLEGPEAARTGEWRDGIGRLAAPVGGAAAPLLAPYLEIVEEERRRHGASAYPGSPDIARAILRDRDRAVLVEKHPEDVRLLARRFRAAANVKVLELDGWIGLRSLVPPPERRGLVLIDPPYEEAGEAGRVGRALAGALTRWPTGIFALWYPVKARAPADALAEDVADAVAAPVLRLEVLVDRPDDPARLNGSGLLVANPPWRLAQDAHVLLPCLAERLSRRGYGAYRCEPLSSGRRTRHGDRPTDGNGDTRP